MGWTQFLCHFLAQDYYEKIKIYVRVMTMFHTQRFSFKEERTAITQSSFIYLHPITLSILKRFDFDPMEQVYPSDLRIKHSQ